jgi:hypothetical protein
MAKHQAIKAVLNNFLGTYTSRYSHYHGYWLFGFLVEKFSNLDFDLLHPILAPQDALVKRAAALASLKFQEQAEKAGLSSRIVAAEVLISREIAEVGQVNSHLCSGYLVRFDATAQSDNGHVYQRSVRMFVAPHSPWRERQSAAVGRDT